MSTKIAVRSLLYDGASSRGLSGNLYRQDPIEGVTWVGRITVPLIDYSSECAQSNSAFDGQPDGVYLVQINLPDGQVRTEQLTLQQGTENRLLIDLPHVGPHEWSAYHALRGEFSQKISIPPAQAVAPDSEWISTWTSHVPDLGLPNGERLRRAGIELKDRILGPLTAGPASTQPAVDTLLLLNTPHSADSSSLGFAELAALMQSSLTPDQLEDALGGVWHPITPTQHDEGLELYEFVNAGSSGDGAQRDDYLDTRASVRRQYILALGPSCGQLCCLPAPWFDSQGREAQVQMLLDRAAGQTLKQAALTVADPMINSVLGYIEHGSISEAARLVDFETARSMLYSKLANPLVACLGAYLLILNLDRESYRAQANDWQSWVRNLSTWFPWLPDGAILESALYFVLGSGKADAAYRALMSAYERGLPFFSFGLSLMLEGLRRFVSEGHDQARQRLLILERIAERSDPSQNFLCVQLSTKQQLADPDPAHHQVPAYG